MGYEYISPSGFFSRDGGVARDRPRDWIVWHFTHMDNLSSIVAGGFLLPDSAVSAPTNVAYSSVKALRAETVVQVDASYPAVRVNEHVPFYIAAKSPMLYVVSRGHSEYSGGTGPLVFFGVALGDIIDSGATWCVSDGNAAAAFTRFSRDVDTLGNFVDFDLLCQKMWSKTPDDQDRPSRRAAEALVLGPVPLSMVSVVCCRDQARLDQAKDALKNVGGVRNHWVLPDMYY